VAAKPKPVVAAPPATEDAAEPSLREYFNDDEGDSSLGTLIEDEELVQADSSVEPPVEPALLIASASTPVKSANATEDAGTEAQPLSSVVGRDVPQVNAWQSMLSLLAVLGLFIGLVHLYQRFRLGGKGTGSRKSLQVIETIGLGPGRQIVIVELQRDALVLGMTPHSINLLDKVPMQALDGSYRDTVDSIISRESTQPQRWAERPAFRMELGGAISMPRLSGMANGHGQPLTVAQLRQARATNGTAVHSVLAQDDHTTKAELIERIRQQLRHMED
jgi:flagellar protein FliO/FliZ